MKTDEHKNTPTPWNVVDHWNGLMTICASSGPIASVEADRPATQNRANAAFIAKAVNSHAALVEALESISTLASCCPHDQPDECNRELVKIMQKASAALALAKGGSLT